MSTSELLDLPRIEVGGREFYTDIEAQCFSDNVMRPYSRPTKFDPVERLGYDFVPAELDTLEERTYRVGCYAVRPVTHEPLGLRSQEVVVRRTEGGLVISEASFGREVNAGNIAGREMLRLAGWQVETEGIATEPKITGVPTPEAFKHAMAQHNVEVRLFPEYGVIPAESYLQAYASGVYPVSSGHQTYFWHDAGNDHAPALLLGGTELSDKLAVVAQRALGEGEDKQGSAVLSIDAYTAALTALLADKTPAPLIHANALRLGEQLGISQYQSGQLLEQMRARMLERGVQT